MTTRKNVRFTNFAEDLEAIANGAAMPAMAKFLYTEQAKFYSRKRNIAKTRRVGLVSVDGSTRPYIFDFDNQALWTVTHIKGKRILAPLKRAGGKNSGYKLYDHHTGTRRYFSLDEIEDSVTAATVCTHFAPAQM